MCRVLLYLGEPALVENLLHKPDNSLVKQSYSPQHMQYIQNLAGFGMAAWDNHSYKSRIPFYYKTEELPFFDFNLKRLASKLHANCLLAHVRGVEYSEREIVNQQNIHPFLYDGYTLAFAHNGSLACLDKIRMDLLQTIRPDIAVKIQGTTDSELIYALLLSQFKEPSDTSDIVAVRDALVQTLKIIRTLRNKHQIFTASPVNLFITNGNFLIVTRFVYDYGHLPKDLKSRSQLYHNLDYHSLWYTYGEKYGFYNQEYKMKGSDKRSSICFASEPLTQDTTTWIEVPEYSIVSAWYENNEISIQTRELDV